MLTKGNALKKSVEQLEEKLLTDYKVLCAKRGLAVKTRGQHDVKTMATTKIPGHQKLFKRMCYMLKVKVTKFLLPRPHSFRAILKNQLGANLPPCPK